MFRIYCVPQAHLDNKHQILTSLIHTPCRILHLRNAECFLQNSHFIKSLQNSCFCWFSCRICHFGQFWHFDDFILKFCVHIVWLQMLHTKFNSLFHFEDMMDNSACRNICQYIPISTMKLENLKLEKVITTIICLMRCVYLTLTNDSIPVKSCYVPVMYKLKL